MQSLLNSARQTFFDEDTILIERYLRGDGAAFDQLYQRYSDRVFQIARGILPTSDDADDVTLEVFSSIYRNLVRFDRRSKFSTWLFRITVNRAIQHGRTLSRRKREQPIELASEVVAPVAESRDDFTDIDTALGQLGPEDRAVLTLFYWQNLDLAEVGQALGCSANAAKTRLFRARERFRKIYEEISR
ncbi:MAG: sigma-70 family RNA polymerase sigma factor [Armatimonadetes bacterium]|nr:sigma-70 family RNA polymerase sigma factor [Armatimonadota bacterium]